jgi:hypothetical protein
MTRQEWDACTDVDAMLGFLLACGTIPERKGRLFALACCREVWDLIELMERLEIGDGSVAVRLGEQFADGETTAAEIASWIIDRVGMIDSGSSPFGHLLGSVLPGLVAANALHGASQSARGAQLARNRHARYLGTRRRGESPSLPSEQSQAEGLVAQLACRARLCIPLRDIFGPLPFRTPRLESRWRTPSVVALAQAAYQKRLTPDPSRPGWLVLDVARILVLGDALEDAGCTEDAILDHCRFPEEHVRGCWVVDMLTGRC